MKSDLSRYKYILELVLTHTLKVGDGSSLPCM